MILLLGLFYDIWGELKKKNNKYIGIVFWVYNIGWSFIRIIFLLRNYLLRYVIFFNDRFFNIGMVWLICDI